MNESIRLLWTAHPRNNGSSRRKVRDFSLLLCISTGFGARSSSYSTDTWGPSPREKRSELEALHSPPYIGEPETQDALRQGRI